jgi:hypothetical protein
MLTGELMFGNEPRERTLQLAAALQMRAIPDVASDYFARELQRSPSIVRPN